MEEIPQVYGIANIFSVYFRLLFRNTFFRIICWQFPEKYFSVWYLENLSSWSKQLIHMVSISLLLLICSKNAIVIWHLMKPYSKMYLRKTHETAKILCSLNCVLSFSTKMIITDGQWIYGHWIDVNARYKELDSIRSIGSEKYKYIQQPWAKRKRSWHLLRVPYRMYLYRYLYR